MLLHQASPCVHTFLPCYLQTDKLYGIQEILCQSPAILGQSEQVLVHGVQNNNEITVCIARRTLIHG